MRGYGWVFVPIIMWGPVIFFFSLFIYKLLTN